MLSLVVFFLLPLLSPLSFIAAQSATNPFPTQSASSYPPPTVTEAERNNWIGVWPTIPGCTPSLTCCCGKGDATITTGPAPGTISMVGATDGGAGCFGYSSLSGVFIVKTPLYAFYNISALNTIVDLNMANDNSKITMKINNPLIQCNQQPSFARQTATTSPPVTSASPTTNPPATSPSGPTLPPPLYSDAEYSSKILRLASDNTSALLIFDLAIDSTTPPAPPNAPPPLDYAVLHYTLCASCPEINVALRAYTKNLYGSNSFLSIYLNSNLNRSSVAHYVYGPISIRTTGEDTLLYYFTYSLSGTAADTRVYMYNPATSNPPATTAPPPNISTTPAPVSTITTIRPAPSSNASYAGRSLVGVYASDNSCVSSSSCCCAVGNLRLASPYDDMVATTATAALLSQISGSPFIIDADHQVFVSARLDGSSACLGQSDITGLFTINNQQSASINLRGVTIATELANDKNTLSFTNSLYPQNCVTKALRTSGAGPTTLVPPPLVTTLPPASEQLDTTPILGVWNSDPNACQVSPSCCCVSGQVSVKNNATVKNTVDVTFTLVGERYSCYQLDRGAITLPFTLVNYSYAYYSPPGMPFVRFETLPNANYSRILIKNTVQTDCVSAVYRQGLHFSAAFGYDSRSSIIGWMMGVSTIIISMAIWKKKGSNDCRSSNEGRIEEEEGEDIDHCSCQETHE